jgi:aminoglycoside phosphotransferase (APT) family kinase protein
MNTFNPSEHPSEISKYLGRFLDGSVHLTGAQPLVESTREAPWRLDVTVDGQARSYVLRLESRNIEHEYEVLRAMAPIPIPTPRAYGWDPEGKALGVPCFFQDFVKGESLLGYLLAGEPWAEDLYIDTACALQSVTWEQMSSVAPRFEEGETAGDVLETAYDYFKDNPNSLADTVYAKLKETIPPLPAPRFSNGDLWPDNLIVRDRQLAGVIDFANAGFSDPFFEFLLPFFLHPELRGRGIEERYCRRMGFDPGMLSWYHGLEYFDTWHWVLKLDEPFEQHTAESLAADLTRWLEPLS